ncbi:MAG: helix-turn-helix domain-containing protein [bacterium]
MVEHREVMTTEEACDYLRTTKTTLFKMVHEGLIPAAKVGNAYRFLKSELEDFLRGRSTESQKKYGDNR